MCHCTHEGEQFPIWLSFLCRTQEEVAEEYLGHFIIKKYDKCKNIVIYLLAISVKQPYICCFFLILCENYSTRNFWVKIASAPIFLVYFYDKFMVLLSFWSFSFILHRKNNQQNVSLCNPQNRQLYNLGMRWVNDRMFIFGWSIPLMIGFHKVCYFKPIFI